MSEAVEILIKADDKASQQVKDAAVNLDASLKRVGQIFASLETPADKLEKQLQDLSKAQAEGVITAEKFAEAETKIRAKLESTSEAAIASAKASEQASAANQRAAQMLASLETPAEQYGKKVAELNLLQRQGAIDADQLAIAQSRLREKYDATRNSVQSVGDKTKLASTALQSVARLAGQSQLAGLARQIGEVAEKSDIFTSSLKAGGAGALVMKAGLVALVATVGAKIGTVLGHWIFQTEKFERSMKNATEASAAFDVQLKALQSAMKSERMEDIELIRNPDEKKAAYATLLADLNRDLQTVSAQVTKGEREVEEWAQAWQVTGNRKAYALMAQEQLAADKQRLANLKAEFTETNKILSERAKINAQIKEENAAKDKSASFIQSLEDELELLKATKEQQIEIEAIRNTTPEDEDKAVRLLRERDAIIAQADAEEKLAEIRKDAAAAEKAREDAREAAAQRELDAAEQDRRNIEDLITSEEDRLELQRIEIEQGKEAAKVKSLTNEGVDLETAKRLAKEESDLERLRESMKPNKVETASSRSGGGLSTLQASESRLLTRGPASTQMDIWQNMERSLRQIQQSAQNTDAATNAAKDELLAIRRNTTNKVQLEAIV